MIVLVPVLVMIVGFLLWNFSVKDPVKAIGHDPSWIHLFGK